MIWLTWLSLAALAGKPNPALCGACAVGEALDVLETHERLACLDARVEATPSGRASGPAWEIRWEDGVVVQVRMDAESRDRGVRSMMKRLGVGKSVGARVEEHGDHVDRLWSEDSWVVRERYTHGVLSSVGLEEFAPWYADWQASLGFGDRLQARTGLGSSPGFDVECPVSCGCPNQARDQSVFPSLDVSDLLAFTAGPRPAFSLLDRATAETVLAAEVTEDTVFLPGGWRVAQTEPDAEGLVRFSLAFEPGSEASPLPVEPSLTRADLVSRYARTAGKDDDRFDLFLPDEDGAPWAVWTFRNGVLTGLELRATQPLTAGGPTWKPTVGCIEHDGSGCVEGSGVYVFADGVHYEGTFFRNGTLVGKVTQHPQTPPWHEGVAKPGASFDLEAPDAVLASAACNGCGEAELLRASALTDDAGTVLAPEDMLRKASGSAPWEVDLLVSQAGWTKQGDRLVPPEGETALVLSAGRIEGVEMAVHDTLPLGLEQGTRAELVGRYGAPYEPTAGQLDLVGYETPGRPYSRAQVRLSFASDDSRVVRVRWTQAALGESVRWGESCVEGPRSTDGDNSCATGDGVRLEGEFRGGELVDGEVVNLDGWTMAELTRTPTAEELAALEAARIAKQAADAAEHKIWLAKRIREPETFAVSASEHATLVLTGSDSAWYATNAQAATRQARYSLDGFASCPAAEPGIEAARARLVAAEAAVSEDPLVTAAALRSIGSEFQRLWAAPAAALAACYDVELAPSVTASPTPTVGSRMRVMRDSGLEVYARPPAGWTCEANGGCSGVAGIVGFFVRSTSNDAESVVRADWSKKRGCVEPDWDEERFLALFCDEGDAETDVRGWAPRSLRLYVQNPAKDKIVVVRAYAPDWGEATTDLVWSLMQTIEVGTAASIGRPPALGGAMTAPPPDAAPTPSTVASPSPPSVTVRAHVWHSVAGIARCATVDVFVPDDGQGWVWLEAVERASRREGYLVFQVDVIGRLDRLSPAQKDKRCGDL
ncbi:MAG: hypothetical protein KC912_25855 [Proteobacteria bacterium]|nr:hypothetical protein [Pseudomonadota bacterium]